MELSRQIRHALEELVKKSLIASCWGLTNIRVSKDSISFEVDGLKYQGLIQIKSNDVDNYLIKIGDKLINDCSINQLITLLDEEIEQVPNYSDTLSEWINKTISIMNTNKRCN